MTDAELVDEIIRREGHSRFADHPDNKWGPTKFGITLKT